MKYVFLILSSLFLMTTLAAKTSVNPFLKPYKTRFEAPPFDKIKVEHYMPAFQKGIELHDAEISGIANNPAAPTFKNTIEALDFSGDLLRKVSLVFFAMTEAETNDSLDSIAEVITPVLSEHNDNLYLNERLFLRIKTLYDQRESLTLDPEQKRVLSEYYKNFVRAGAGLNASDKERLRAVNKQISSLMLKFSDNVLKETNAFKLVLENPSNLAGLPKSSVDAAAETARNMGKTGWVFTLQKPSLIPFLQYSDKRELREKMFNAYNQRGDNNNDQDNKLIVTQLVNLRLERANLLGFKSHAAYVLDENMAKTPETVMTFLDKIWIPALKKAKEEVAEMQKLIDTEGGGFKLQAWDWWYYTEKLRKAKFDLDESELRPYFKLENVRQGVFTVANKLWGLQFKPVKKVQVYHPDVEVFEVLDKDGTYLGLFYSDYFPRPGKRAGAWMSNLRESYVKDGKEVRPIIYNVGNFTKPTADTPSLLNIDEVETLFHEFGHAMHGMLTKCHYLSVSGTNVPRDFVELPSQIMENWCMNPEVLKLYAKHYQTGETIPDSLIEKIQRAATFNQGFETTELVAAALLDMEWHQLTSKQDVNVDVFEAEALRGYGLIEEIAPRYRSVFFNHIFSNDYSAGYYAYLWAEVLDADAFNLFLEKGVFDPETAASFRKNILEKGNSEEPMELYRKFRGADPNPEALLKRRGL
jgi:peptidyl-dipeptidase Dcp